jgi:hypothetical protein
MNAHFKTYQGPIDGEENIRKRRLRESKKETHYKNTYKTP